MNSENWLISLVASLAGAASLLYFLRRLREDFRPGSAVDSRTAVQNRFIHSLFSGLCLIFLLLLWLPAWRAFFGMMLLICALSAWWIAKP